MSMLGPSLAQVGAFYAHAADCPLCLSEGLSVPGLGPLYGPAGDSPCPGVLYFQMIPRTCSMLLLHKQILYLAKAEKNYAYA